MLWDVDGTLMSSTRLVRDARARALCAVYGLEGEPSRVAGGGMTDPQLTLEVLALHGWSEECALERLDAFREVYVANLTTIAASLPQDLVVLPGVFEVLARLHSIEVKQSLLTGNYESAARLKVRAAGLDRYFDLDIGAFGSDDRDRLSLVPVALDKARRIRGEELSAGEVVVIGDSPRDIACARSGGARAVAVATGPHSMDELADHHPDALLEDLRDTATAVGAILARFVD